MLKGKNVLVLGLGISGRSTVKFLAKQDCKILVADSKPVEELAGALEELGQVDYEFCPADSSSLEGLDLIVKSPGIAPSHPFLVQAKARGIKIISDMELGYIYRKTQDIIAITGTNGKTSTTSLVASLFEGLRPVYTCGNIGIGILETMETAEADSVVVMEASSFQLEDTSSFKPRIASLINLSPDHLDWHGSYENYIGSKLKIFQNQDGLDYSIINADDDLLLKASSKLRSKKIYFSSKKILENGFYIEGAKLVYGENGRARELLDQDQLDIIPENALVALAIGWAMGLDLDYMVVRLKAFKGLAHRMEFVRRVAGLDFYNDSKGTNPDSTMKAIESLEGRLGLIAGGYDKGLSFHDMLLAGKDKLAYLILMGQTREKIKLEARELGYEKIYLVDSMEEAVELGLGLAGKIDKLLLSPACASWGSYQNFEERGDHFKKIVNEIR